MNYLRPRGILAGFHSDAPDPGVPEITHIGEQWIPTTYKIPWHEHAVWEFYLQLDGISVWESARLTYKLTTGHFFAAPPKIRHQLKDNLGKHHFFYAGIDVAAVLRRHPALAKEWTALRCVHIPKADSLAAPFRQLIREVTMQSPHRAEGMCAALDYVVIEATRLLGRAEQKAVMPLHPAVAIAQNILEQHCDQPWRLRELGKLVGISPNHLVELFGKEVGVSPRQFLLQKRIERAKDALRDSDISVTQLGLSLGFSSSQHFAKMFKRFAGVSAQAYRKRVQRRQR